MSSSPTSWCNSNTHRVNQNITETTSFCGDGRHKVRDLETKIGPLWMCLERWKTWRVLQRWWWWTVVQGKWFTKESQNVPKVYIENEFHAYQIPPGNLSTKIIKSASMMRVALQGNINEANNSSNGSLKLIESLALNILVAKKIVF